MWPRILFCLIPKTLLVAILLDSLLPQTCHLFFSSAPFPSPPLSSPRLLEGRAAGSSHGLTLFCLIILITVAHVSVCWFWVSVRSKHFTYFDVFNLHHDSEGTIIIPVVQMRKLKCRQVHWLVQDCMASKQWCWCDSPGILVPESMYCSEGFDFKPLCCREKTHLPSPTLFPDVVELTKACPQNQDWQIGLWEFYVGCIFIGQHAKSILG